MERTAHFAVMSLGIVEGFVSGRDLPMKAIITYTEY